MASPKPLGLCAAEMGGEAGSRARERAGSAAGWRGPAVEPTVSSADTASRGAANGPKMQGRRGREGRRADGQK